MKGLLALLLIVCTVLVVACGGAPTPDKAAIETEVAMNVFATLTAQAPTATPIPTDTPTATFTPLPPSPSPTPTLTATPTATSTPLATPTNTPIPTPTPIPPTPISPIYDGTREHPYPLGMESSTYYDDWEEAWLAVSITEMVRGEEAWQRIQAANIFNDSPSSVTST